MRNVIALARSRASFFTFCNSFRNSCVSATFAELFLEKPPLFGRVRGERTLPVIRGINSHLRATSIACAPA